MIQLTEFKGLSVISKKDYNYLGIIIPAGTKFIFNGCVNGRYEYVA
jgi:hypothetical protein